MQEQAAGAAAAALGTGFIIIALLWLLGLALFVTWIISLVEVIKSEFKNSNDKTMWLLLLIFIAPLATVLYQIIGRGQRWTPETKKMETATAGKWEI